MSPSSDSTHRSDGVTLVREGTSQNQRLSPALDPLKPAYPMIDEQSIAQRMVFAASYSQFLKYFDATNSGADDWVPFFNSDVSVQLAQAAVQDVGYYKSRVQECLNYLKNPGSQPDLDRATKSLGLLFGYLGMLAGQLDLLKEGLPAEIPLKGTLQSLIKNQLAPPFRRLLAYYKADLLKSDRLIAVVVPDIVVLGATPADFSAVYLNGLSGDWMTDGAANWGAYTKAIEPDDSVFGSGGTAITQINHIATNNLFASILDQFLKTYARTVSEAGRALEKTCTEWDGHEPHYALFLAFLHLFEYARNEMNRCTGRHLDFYYREVLRLKEKPAQPGSVHLLVELAKQVPQQLLTRGELFKAGKDDLGKDLFFANDRDFVANQAQVVSLRTVYRHKYSYLNDFLPGDDNRMFASPVADSDDGLGADHSWHPFFHKNYQDGKLAEIKMPQAELGFAIASHYLLMSGGDRSVAVEFTVSDPGALGENYLGDVTCLLTTAKGWFEAKADGNSFKIENAVLRLFLKLSAAPAIVPYASKTHGYDFATDLPVLLVKLTHRDAEYGYHKLKGVVITTINLQVDVDNLRTLSLSNDFGPVDTSKPFHPFGAAPVAGSSLVIGSKEVFQKKLKPAAEGKVACWINASWLTSPKPYDSVPVPRVEVEPLVDAQWTVAAPRKPGESAKGYQIYEDIYTLTTSSSINRATDLSLNDLYDSVSRNGFVRLRLQSDFGTAKYQEDLLKYLKKDTGAVYPGNPTVGPTLSSLSMGYQAVQTIALDSGKTEDFTARETRFFHITPFGHAEQHLFLKSPPKVPDSGTIDQAIYLLPQFAHRPERKDRPVEHEAEFYLGISALKPPRNLALLFQVADGTADPLAQRPPDHLHWSYLRGNEWIPFDRYSVEDQTDGMLNSGIITFAVPLDASDSNTLLPAGKHWLRGAVAAASGAVCRLRLVAAQALKATFTDRGIDPNAADQMLPSGTINKLDQPQAAIKKISQPFSSFGGRGKETPAAFYTRVSERLRHKDRAITLWDYERLVLEEFPQVYKVKCLNHTEYEAGIYRELAPGHVTIVTIPNQQFHNLRDPLRPCTSEEQRGAIKAFLTQRISSFVTLHISNPEFEEVQVAFKVRLRKGFDESFYTGELSNAITRFLSPWAFTEGGSPSFGGKIYKSVLINFLEDQKCVDYVTDFRLFHTFQGSDNAAKTVEKDEIEGTKAVSVLVSARGHNIEAVASPGAVAPIGGIGKCQP